ncbi:MAG: hypothetical protein ACT4NY_23585 [Pseudonocardiales bacterium]
MGQTPRLREALGHARVGDKQATWQLFGQAEALFGVGPHDDDPPWPSSWPRRLWRVRAWHEMRAA